MPFKITRPGVLVVALLFGFSTKGQRAEPNVDPGVYLVGGAMMFFALGLEASETFEPTPSPFLEQWVEPLAVKGSYALAGGWWIWAKVEGDPERLRVAQALVRSVAYSTAGSLALKAVFRRTRPGIEPDGWFEYGLEWDLSDAFPSGHSAVSVSMATTLVYSYPDEDWLPWVAYPIAGMACWERVANGKHHPTDVVAGALLGYSTGILALKPLEWERWGVRTYLGPGSFGMVWDLDGKTSPASTWR